MHQLMGLPPLLKKCKHYVWINVLSLCVSVGFLCNQNQQDQKSNLFGRGFWASDAAYQM
jgi:hypothetical protein